MKKSHLFLFILCQSVLISCKKDPKESKYTLTTAESTAEWKGYLANDYFNKGSIAVKSTDITVKDNIVVGGTFELPLLSIENHNLETVAQKLQLIEHLQSDAFFNMALHPNISFTIKSVKPYTGDPTYAIEGANYTITGSLTILGKPLDISFAAKIDINQDDLFVNALIKVDRTKWGINFAADPGLPPQERILPNINIELNLKCKKQ